MTDTSTAALVAASGGVGAFLGASLTTYFNIRTQDRTHRREQLLRDAEVLGPIREYLEILINPERLAVNAPADDQEAKAFYERLISRRDLHLAAMNVMASGHPDANVRAVAKEFANELFNAGHSAGWVLRDPLPVGRLRDAAIQDHQNALELLDELHHLSTAYGDK
ncbi:hypothetical protein [Nocardioides flavescens]|uniref:Uncharacterized protein n=1 Tax=Nocardioides flavescens TaxID=2691959 RepID=A0A6L7F4E3_9ACTN|nr:hypothetical protein [Nocardioides flavescens]MXG92056.1 hypothetical protein [Nocardioides flavescens]